MKFIKIIFICLLLCSCGKQEDITTKLDEIFSNSDAGNSVLNNYSQYIDYYKPGDVYEVEADEISHVFSLNNGKFIMNINIAGIVSSNNYDNYTISEEGFFDDAKLIYHKESYFLDDDNNQIVYFFNLYEQDGVYLLHFVDYLTDFYGYSLDNEITLMASKIYNMAKSCDVDISEIMANYSSQDVIEYQKTAVNLFETVMPVEGRIEDMMIEDTEVSDN